jgi:hypothetical protein
MNRDLSAFAARLRQSIASGFDPRSFDALAVELFALQYAHNAAYRKICDRQGITPALAAPWNRLPFAPTNAFKNNGAFQSAHCRKIGRFSFQWYDRPDPWLPFSQRRVHEGI